MAKEYGIDINNGTILNSDRRASLDDTNRKIKQKKKSKHIIEQLPDVVIKTRKRH